MKSTRDLVEQAKASIELISPQDAQNELATGVPLLVDVREPNESEVHIAGAVLVPRGLLEFVADPECGPRLPPSLQVGLDPTRRVIVYCNTGGRAALAAVTLSQIGYQRQTASFWLRSTISRLRSVPSSAKLARWSLRDQARCLTCRSVCPRIPAINPTFEPGTGLPSVSIALTMCAFASDSIPRPRYASQIGRAHV